MVNLLIVESPGKIKKIKQILPDGWIVSASMGHIRQLSHDGEDNLGFDLVGDFVKCRLDRIACGKLNWQKYITDWNRGYFAPALIQSYSLLPPESKNTGKTQGKTSTTKYICPVCQKSLEQYSYTKECQEKSLLRCSDSQARRKPNHRIAVFFRLRLVAWWSKDFGELGEGQITSSLITAKNQNPKPPLRSDQN